MLDNTLQRQGHETYFTAKQKFSMIPNYWKIEDNISVGLSSNSHCMDPM